jgi:hypothetical protein
MLGWGAFSWDDDFSESSVLAGEPLNGFDLTSSGNGLLILKMLSESERCVLDPEAGPQLRAHPHALLSLRVVKRREK